MDQFPLAVLSSPPLTVEYSPLATWLAKILEVCKSTAFTPRLLPPTAVPSGISASNAPVPLGTIATSMLGTASLGVKLATVIAALGAVL